MFGLFIEVLRILDLIADVVNFTLTWIRDLGIFLVLLILVAVVLGALGFLSNKRGSK